MPTTRANFLKTLVAGIAAAPVMASTKTHDHVVAPAAPGKWKEKHWKKGELKFSEFILPITMQSTFEEVRKDRPMHRKIMIPMFDRTVVDAPFDTIVESLMVNNERRARNVKRHGMPVVDEDGNAVDFGADDKTTNYITIVRVEGHKDLMGIGLTEFKLTPVRDYYRDVADRNRRVKKGFVPVGREDDTLPSHAQPLSGAEVEARESGRVGKTSVGPKNLF